MYSIKEFAEMFRLSYMFVWKLVTTEKIKAIKIGGVYRISQDEVDRVKKEGVA